MRVNPVKDSIQEGGFALGSEISRLPSRDVCRIYAKSGFDFVFIDMEHTCFSFETVAGLIESARTYGIVPLVRVPQAEYAFVARALDAGAQGIIVPRVDRPETAADIVSWTRYPPQGVRGYAATIAQTDGEQITPADFMEANHQQTLMVIQIERAAAFDCLEEILSVDGIDVACLGYMDLTVDLGIPGEIDHSLAVDHVERLIQTSQDHGIAPGIISSDLAVVHEWMDRGMRFVSYSTETILLEQASNKAAEALRTKVASMPNTSSQKTSDPPKASRSSA